MMIAFVENLVFFPYCGGVEKKPPKTFLNSNYGASLLKREHFFPPKISGNDHPQLPNTRAIKCPNCFPFAFLYQRNFKQKTKRFVCYWIVETKVLTVHVYVCVKAWFWSELFFETQISRLLYVKFFVFFANLCFTTKIASSSQKIITPSGTQLTLFLLMQIFEPRTLSKLSGNFLSRWSL